MHFTSSLVISFTEAGMLNHTLTLGLFVPWAAESLRLQMPTRVHDFGSRVEDYGLMVQYR